MEIILKISLLLILTVGVALATLVHYWDKKQEFIAVSTNAVPVASATPSPEYWNYGQVVYNSLTHTSNIIGIINPNGAWQVAISPWFSQRGYHYKAHFPAEPTRQSIQQMLGVLQLDIDYWCAFFGLPPVKATLSLANPTMLIITLSPAGQAQPMPRPKVVI